MKQTKILLLIMILISLPLLLNTLPAWAEEVEIKPVYGQEYACGDDFSVSLVYEPTLAAAVTHKKALSPLIAYDYKNPNDILGACRKNYGNVDYSFTIKPTHTLFITRIRLRNATAQTIKGLSPDSFILTGYLKGKGKDYPASAILEADYHGPVSDGYIGNNVRYEICGIQQDYHPTNLAETNMDPLRVWEMVVIFDVKPFLYNWELSILPKDGSGKENPSVCKMKLKMQSLKNEVTGEITKHHYN